MALEHTSGQLVALEYWSGQLVALEHESEVNIEFGTGSLWDSRGGEVSLAKFPIHPPSSTGGIRRSAVGLPHDY